MHRYQTAGQGFEFPCPVPELQPFADGAGATSDKDPFVPHSFLKNEPGASLSCQTIGWVGGAYRRVETWSTPQGTLLKVDGGNDFYISPGGLHILPVNDPCTMTDLDREILVGPALVLALALRGTWCLHASAVSIGGLATLFLGESGQGKSTLAAYLRTTFPRVADDILPVTMNPTRLTVWPRFPQLKLPVESQPGASMPESLPAGAICVLTGADSASDPALKRLSPSQATQTLLRHTAGTRLFEADMLARHLEFCAQAARQVPMYQMNYPHRREALTQVKELLQGLC